MFIGVQRGTGVWAYIGSSERERDMENFINAFIAAKEEAASKYTAAAVANPTLATYYTKLARAARAVASDMRLRLAAA
jgi:hypothetical protein